MSGNCWYTFTDLISTSVFYKVLVGIFHELLMVLFDGEPLKDVNKFKYLDSMFVANGQDTEEIRSRINLARSAFSQREI